jgi:hypothetical protein
MDNVQKTITELIYHHNKLLDNIYIFLWNYVGSYLIHYYFNFIFIHPHFLTHINFQSVHIWFICVHHLMMTVYGRNMWYMVGNNKKFRAELIAYFHLILHGPHRKRRLQRFFFDAGTSLPSCYLATIGGYTDRPTDSPLIRHGQHGKWRVQQFFFCSVYSLPRERVYRAVA